ncbi:hypothetical protein I552_4242 [Mycobacterium xenopi 3993]|nr:hypothetical protein I552_4242 [Mycobacterium xenopi 3993]
MRICAGNPKRRHPGPARSALSVRRRPGLRLGQQRHLPADQSTCGLG